MCDSYACPIACAIPFHSDALADEILILVSKAEAEESCDSPLAPGSTLQSTVSVRNYKRPHKAVGSNQGRKDQSLSESMPHIYKENKGSYFSWLHLLGRSSNIQDFLHNPH